MSIKKRFFYVVLMILLLMPFSTKAADYYDGGNNIEEITEVPIEDMPFVKSKKVHITSRDFIKKSCYLIVWDKMQGADGYQFKLCINKSFKKKYKPSQTDIYQNRIQINKIKKKKTYYYKIRAYDESSGKRVYSKWSKTYSVKRKR